MFSAILKLILLVQILDVTMGLPLGAEESEMQENIVWVPLPMSYLSRVSAALHSNHRSWPKRNSELITSLLGIDKNIEMAGK